MTLREQIARLLVEADGECPDDFHTKAAREEADKHGHAMTDHAIPLWRNAQLPYWNAAKAILAIPEIAEALKLSDYLAVEANQTATNPRHYLGSSIFTGTRRDDD